VREALAGHGDPVSQNPAGGALPKMGRAAPDVRCSA
jgi:hypothetical protein